MDDTVFFKVVSSSFTVDKQSQVKADTQKQQGESKDIKL